MSLSFEIGLASAGDAQKLAEMSRDLVENGLGWSWKAARIRHMIRHPDAVVIAARNRLEIVGFAVMEFHELHAHLSLLAVSQRHQRMGIGRQLMDWLHESAQVAGIARIQLELRAGNQEARRFYESLGFEMQGFVSGYYQGRESAVQMVRRLIDPSVEAQRP